MPEPSSIASVSTSTARASGEKREKREIGATIVNGGTTATSDRPYIGGQAVIEGVMMRSPASLAIAVRRADGSISIRERPVLKTTSRTAKIPLLRGMSTLVESLRMGSEALRFSGELYERDLAAAEEAASPNANGAPDAPKGGDTKKKTEGIIASSMQLLSAFTFVLLQLFVRADSDSTATPSANGSRDSTGSPGGDNKGSGDEGGRGINPMAIMTILAVAFMVALPQLLAFGASSLFNMSLDVRSPKFQLLTGFFKLTVVVGYMLLIRRVKEIHRVFQYHGAEHKTISTYEAREDLVVENARKKSTLHPRCGTTFLVMTVLVSIVIWTALGPLLPKTGLARWQEQVLFFLMKLPFLPLLAGITFEIQRFTARYCLTGPLSALLWPGFMIQKITTIEPSDDQLEIALASLRATLWRESVGTDAAAPKGDNEVLAFASYDALVAAPGLRNDGF